MFPNHRVERQHIDFEDHDLCLPTKEATYPYVVEVVQRGTLLSQNAKTELGQYPAIFTSRLVNNAYIIFKSSRPSVKYREFRESTKKNFFFQKVLFD